MPLSHVGLTVSNLQYAGRFYQAALRPLGYRCIDKDDTQLAFGVTEADFFLCQDPSRGWPSGAHIAFAAQSVDEVDDFYAAAIRAGGRSYSSPMRARSDGNEYSASVIDVDNNAVEVTYGISVGRSPSHHAYNASSSLTGISSQRLPVKAIADNIANTISATAVDAQSQPPSNSNGLLGTLVGAAAGAAIAYALTKDQTHSDVHRGSAPIREVIVRHTVEYSPVEKLSSQHSIEKDKPHPPFSTPKVLPVESADGRYSIHTVKSSHHPHAQLALPAPTLSTGSPTTVVAARSGTERPSSHVKQPERSCVTPSKHPGSRPSVRSSHRSTSYPPPNKIPLPPSTKVSRDSRLSRDPNEVSLPLSTRGSRASLMSREPREIPLPVSAKTSFISRQPSPPRSAGAIPASAARTAPLTEANIARVAVSEGGNGVADDTATVKPEDSISQASEKMRRREFRKSRAVNEHVPVHVNRKTERRETARESYRSDGHSSQGESNLRKRGARSIGSRHCSAAESKQSLASLPRSSVKVFGLGG